MLDLTNLPVSGGMLLGMLLYCLLSVFGTGQVVGERLIAKSDWPAMCQRQILAELQSSQPAIPQVPTIDCNGVFGSFFGSQGQEICRRYGNFKLPFMDQLQAQQDRLATANNERLQNATAKTSSRCECAASLALEENRISLGLHAGSLRLITPASVRGLNSELQSALYARACSLKGAMQ